MEKDRLTRLEDKIDKISDKLQEINLVMVENTQSLIIHEKRTDLAEKKLSLLEDEFKEKSQEDKASIGKIETKLEPIHNHVIMVNTILKYVLPSVLAILAFLLKIGIIKY
jgi:chromosome segregation ATPase